MVSSVFAVQFYSLLTSPKLARPVAAIKHDAKPHAVTCTITVFVEITFQLT